MAIIIHARDFQHEADDHAEAVSQEVSGIEPSVGSVGDSYDNAMAEAVIGLYRPKSFGAEARGANTPPSSQKGSRAVQAWQPPFQEAT